MLTILLKHNTATS